MKKENLDESKIQMLINFLDNISGESIIFENMLYKLKETNNDRLKGTENGIDWIQKQLSNIK